MKNILLIAFVTISTLSFGQNPPVAVDDTVTLRFDVTHAWDSIPYLAFQLAFKASDPDGDSIFVDSVFYNGSGAVSTTPYQNSVGFIYYTPSSGFWGTDTIFCILRDDGVPVRYDTCKLIYVIQHPTFELLDANNILATIDKDVLFSNQAGAIPGFEAPVGSNSHSIYAANLWVAGKNNNVIFTNVRQFGDSTYSEDQSSNCGPINDQTYQSNGNNYNGKWDRVWKVKQYEIDYHLANWNSTNYNPPTSFLEWPAHGDTTIGEAYYLAPFIDADNDGVYNPYKGDYPEIKGDQAVYFIYNDGFSLYSINPLKTEIHGMAYAFQCQDSALQNTVFVDYRIINRSNLTYDSTYFGLWADLDIGNPQDDYIQCDVDRSLGFALNGTDFDDDFNGNHGYGNNPPSQGVIVLKGAKQDDDGLDNDFGIGVNQTINGNGFGDGVTDNEYWGLEYFSFEFLYYGAPPNFELRYYSNLSGTDTLGNPWAFDFLNTGNPIPIKFLFPGSSDTYNYSTNGTSVPAWTEYSTGNSPGDRKNLSSTGPVTFAPGDEIELTYAFVFGRDYVNTGAQAGVTNMLERADSIRSYYNQGMLTACGFPVSVKEPLVAKSDLVIYPNPTNNLINIRQEKASSITIQVLDITGKVLVTKSSTNQLTTIDLSEFTNGIYLVKVSSDDGVRVEKVIKE